MAKICNALISIGLVQAMTAAQCQAFEFEASDIPSTGKVVQLAVTRISKSLQGNGRVSQKRFARNFTTPVFKTRGAVGKETLGRPIALKLDLAARPVGALRRLKIEPIVDLRASRAIASGIPGKVEVLVAPRIESDSSVQLLYRLSF